MDLQSKWYKVKYVDSQGEVFYYLVNLPQLISLIIVLDDGEFLEFTPSKVGYAFESDKE